MINRVFRLVDVKRIEMSLSELSFTETDVIVRPEYLSICAADQRYYLGKRKRDILEKKLPMALIHEGVGTVLHDFTGEYCAGSKVVIIPLEEPESSDSMKPNYDERSRFMSSGADGFTQDFIALPKHRFLPVPDDNYKIFVLSELVSVVFNAVETFNKCRVAQNSRIGVWGDGSMGYITSLVLKCLFPGTELFIFGKTMRKLQRFSFADRCLLIDNIPSALKLSHCFECVGGKGSELAISQMLQHISPQGCISLLGVSEDPVLFDTRTILEKGVQILGNSRSSRDDFISAVKLIRENRLCQKYLAACISQTVPAHNEDDLIFAFEQDVLNDFKTVIKWGL